MQIKYEIVPLTENHIDGIDEIDKLCFDSPWSRESFKKEIDNPIAFYFVAQNEGQVLGYGGMWWSFDTCEITNIAVHPNFRRHGIGKNVLLKLIDECKELEVKYLNLEVRKSNESARSLYIKSGFMEVGLRKGYYSNGEDAVLMTKEI